MLNMSRPEPPDSRSSQFAKDDGVLGLTMPRAQIVKHYFIDEYQPKQMLSLWASLIFCFLMCLVNICGADVEDEPVSKYSALYS